MFGRVVFAALLKQRQYINHPYASLLLVLSNYDPSNLTRAAATLFKVFSVSLDIPAQSPRLYKRLQYHRANTRNYKIAKSLFSSPFGHQLFRVAGTSHSSKRKVSRSFGQSARYKHVLKRKQNRC